MNFDEDQEKAIKLATSGDDLVIEARAGTGKTTTNIGIAKRSIGKKGAIFTFNKSMSDDNSKKSPSNFKCRTPHSQAFISVGTDYIDRLKPNFNTSQLSKRINLNEFDISTEEKNKLIIDTFKAYCAKDNDIFEANHVNTEHIHHIKNEKELEEIKTHVANQCQIAWEEISHVNSRVDITHDFYLKLYSLSKPKMDFDLIILDEAQDSTPCVMTLINEQECQKIITGDRFQSIYGWRGCINGMVKNNIKNKTFLTKSFRFGNEIAEAANYVLSEHNQSSDCEIVGDPNIKSMLNADVMPNAIIYRNTLDMVDEMFFSINSGLKPHVIGGLDDLYRKVVNVNNLRLDKVKFGRFYRYEQFEDYMETVKRGPWLTFSKLLKTYSIESLFKLFVEINNIEQHNANVKLLSAHKSKGLQFPHTKLSNGFKSPENKGWTIEEGNLLYVALTRARLTLNIEDCDAFEYCL